MIKNAQKIIFYYSKILKVPSSDSRKGFLLVLLTLACWIETLDTASWLIYIVIAEETDYRTISLKSRGKYGQLSQSAVLRFCYTS